MAMEIHIDDPTSEVDEVYRLISLQLAVELYKDTVAPEDPQEVIGCAKEFAKYLMEQEKQEAVDEGPGDGE